MGELMDDLYLEKCQEVNKLKAQVARLKRLCPPCRIGQDAWMVRTYNGKLTIRKGTISEMYYIDNSKFNMQLIVVIWNIGRGIIGKDVFLSQEAAEKAKGGAE